jgi:hypothetical protein
MEEIVLVLVIAGLIAYWGWAMLRPGTGGP